MTTRSRSIQATNDVRGRGPDSRSGAQTDVRRVGTIGLLVLMLAVSTTLAPKEASARPPATAHIAELIWIYGFTCVEVANYYHCTDGEHEYYCGLDGICRITKTDLPTAMFEPPHPDFVNIRLDFCRESGSSCGAPVAHRVCEGEYGRGWLATWFEEGAPATDQDPTMTLDDRTLCNSEDCSGVEFVECVDATETHARPGAIEGRVSACYRRGVDCGGSQAANAVCRQWSGADWTAVSWRTEDPKGFTYYIGETGTVLCADCDALADVQCAYHPPTTDVPNDADLDGVTDSSDNCVGTPNPLQENADRDSHGDHCDLEPEVAAGCDNGVDDDGDGLVDADDPGCAEASDETETDPNLACDNLVDDDGDGLADMADEGCSAPGDASEESDELAPLRPTEGAELSVAPSLHWSGGGYDYVFVMTYFKEGGIRDVHDFWTNPEKSSSFQVPAPWWDLVDEGERHYWLVVGLDVETRSYEVSAWSSFVKVAPE